MEKENNKDAEDYLGTFSLKPAPPGLKDKILDGALQKGKSNNGMTTFLWKGFVGCFILLFIVIAVDATITQSQNRRFSSLLGKQQESTDNSEEEWSMMKDIIWEYSDSTKNKAKINFYTLLEKSKNKRRQHEWRESLEEEFE